MLIVRVWAAPEAEAQLLAWLDGGHIAEVARQPGFLWARRLRIEAPDAKGWRGHTTVYGISDRAAFERYEADAELKRKFAQERAPFEAQIRIERFSGEVAARA